MELPDYLKKLLPFDSHYAQIAGHRMHYIDEGQGDVVVLLHGNPTWCFFYRELISELSKNFRVIAPDFIGCGLSDHPTGKRFRAVDRVAHLEALLNKLEIDKLSLVMHDWGGSIGTSFAVRNVARIRKLCYLNTTLTETETLPWIIKIATKPIIGKILTKYTRRFLKLTTGQGVYRKLAKEVKRGYMFPYRSSSRRSAIWDFVADIPWDSSHPTYAEMLFLAEKLPSLSQVPVKIIWGLRDPCFHREMLTKVAHHFPQADVLEIADASHLVLEDAPELVCSEVAAFFEGDERQAPESVPAPAPVWPENPLWAGFAVQAAEAPQLDAVVETNFIGDAAHYKKFSFGMLSQLVHKYRRGLAQLGLARGDKVLMLAQPGADFLALTYAVFASGAVPFFLDPGMGRENLMRCIEEINPDGFIGSPRAQLLRLKRKKIFPNLKFHLTTSEWIYTGGPNISFLKKFAALPLDLAPAPRSLLVAYTSGGTGIPKGVEFTAEMLAEQLRIFSDSFGLKAGDKDIPLLPIFSIFSLALGVCSVLPPIDPAKPLNLEAWKILTIANGLNVQSSFGSPTLWNKIGEYCFRSGDVFRSLKKVFMAGAPVSTQVIKRVKSVLSDGEVYTPYGSTEALPVTLISGPELEAARPMPAEGGEQGTLVGRPLPQVQVRIVRAAKLIDETRDLNALPTYQIGEILVSGANVSPTYFHRESATRLGKPVESGRVWHRMGDLGYLDEAGNLYFCGRAAHSVTAKGRTFYSIPTERIFNQHEKVRRSALVSLNGGEDVGIAVEPHPQHWPESEDLRASFAEELVKLAKSDPLTSQISRVFFHPSFPVDGRHNAKIFRDQLSQWASEISRLGRAA